MLPDLDRVASGRTPLLELARDGRVRGGTDVGTVSATEAAAAADADEEEEVEVDARGCECGEPLDEGDVAEFIGLGPSCGEKLKWSGRWNGSRE